MEEKDLTKKIAFRFSPNKVSNYFSYNCPRYFVFNFLKLTTEDESLEIKDKNMNRGNSSSGSSFSAIAGNKWERVVYNSLLRKTDILNVINYEENYAINADTLMGVIESIDDKPIYIYQPQFLIKENSFLGYHSLLLDEIEQNSESYIDVCWGGIKPDFLYVSKRTEVDEYDINVIDVKLARAPHLSHKIQVALYVKLLNQFMIEYCESDNNWKKADQEYCFISPSNKVFHINCQTGYIFSNRNNVYVDREDTVINIADKDALIEDSFSFDLGEFEVFLEEFFSKDLCEIVKKSSLIISEKYGQDEDDSRINRSCMDELIREVGKKLDFCIGANCEGCGSQLIDGSYVHNCVNCMKWGIEEDSVQLYPYMTRRAQNHIINYSKKHSEDAFSNVPNIDGNSSSDRVLLSYKNINEYINFLRSHATGTDENMNEDSTNHWGILYDELKGNYSWNRYVAYNNFSEKFVKALDYRKNKDRTGLLISAMQQDDTEENETEQVNANERRVIRNSLVNSMGIPKEQHIALFMSFNKAMGVNGREIVYAYRIRINLTGRFATERQREFINAFMSGKVAIDDNSYDIVHVADKFVEECDVSKSFVEELYNIINSLSEYNKELPITEFNSYITLQGYVFDREEYDEIYDFLLQEVTGLLSNEYLDTDGLEYVQKLTKILFWMQGDQIVSALSEHPEQINDVPVAVIHEEISKLYEIPAYVTINMWNICCALLDNKNDYEGLDKLSDKFCSSFSDRVVVSSLYDKNKDDYSIKNKEEFLNYYQLRIDVQEKILSKIQCSYTEDNQREGIGLYHILGPFILPGAICADTLISKLIFERQNELYLEYCNSKKLIMRSPASAIAAKKMIVISECVQLNGNCYEGKINREQSMEFDRLNEAYLIRCSSLERGRAELSRCTSFKGFGSNNYGGDEATVYLIRSIVDQEDDDKVRFSCDSNRLIFDADDKCIIIEKPFVFTTFMELSGLQKIGFHRENDEVNRDDAIRLLHPSMVYKHRAVVSDSYTVWNDRSITEYVLSENPGSMSEIGGYNFVGAQWDAFRHLVNYNITLLQGPPGTGKTDFIGRSVVTLAKQIMEYRECNRPFRILVGGFTHASINNALKKIYEIATLAGINNNISFYKDNDNEKGFQIAEITEIRDLSNVYLSLDELGTRNPGMTWSDAFADDTNNIQVFGSTCWQALKTNPKYLDGDEKIAFRAQNREGELFDLVIIDEASQMTVAQALFLMAYGSIYQTHYLIVGDNHQLPPIIRGKYQSYTNESDIYSSIFNYYLDENKKIESEDGNYLYSLNTEFRMNEALCNYSAKSIYNSQSDFVRNGREYSAFHTVRDKKINYVPDWENIVVEDWARCALDPEYPFSVIYLDGNISERIKNAEIEIVARLADYFEKIMVDSDGNKYFDFNTKGLPLSISHFWGTGLARRSEQYTLERFRQNNIPDERLVVNTPAFGILSPYHRQINAIVDKVLEDYADKNQNEFGNVCQMRYVDGGYKSRENDGHASVPKNKLLIDTVNKLQGQEREAVIVSYGLYDPEEAIKQGEFIYNYQRLNVALTRGKKKTILILSRALANKPIEMLDSNDEELIKGVSFLCNLEKYIKRDDNGYKISEWKSNDNPNSECPGKSDGVTVEIYQKGLQ